MAATDAAAEPGKRGDASRRTFALALVAIIAVGILRIVLTYDAFNQTWDEAPHLAAGMEWIERGTYEFEPKHTPLARIAMATGPYWAGIRLPEAENMWEQGTRMLHSGGQYRRNLALARGGILPFFALTVIAGALLASFAFGRREGIIAALVVSTLPPVLAHSGFATTDAALTATLSLAAYAFARWLQDPTRLRSLALGSAAALAALSKLSTVLFLPAVVATIACGYVLLNRGNDVVGSNLIRRTLATTSRMLRRSSLVLVGAFLTVWATYRFSTAPLTTADARPHEYITRVFGEETALANVANGIVESVPIPAPEFLLGLNQLRNHAEEGHNSYLLGQVRSQGWWYYFPVVLLFKSPLPFLLLALGGVVLAVQLAKKKPDWRAVAVTLPALTLVLVCLPTSINIGVRHILPAYVFFAVAASLACTWLWNHPVRSVGRGIVVVLGGWYMVSTVLVHPDYLSYFNELAGRHPERILVQSDLDWGQDLYRLERALKKHGATELAIAYSGSAEPELHTGVPTRKLAPGVQARGWFAVSELTYVLNRGKYAWLDSVEMVERVGASIRLYRIP